MTRKTYLQIPLILIGALMLSVIGLATWIVALIPVMIYPKLTKVVRAERVTETVTKKMIRQSMGKVRA